MLLVFDLLPKVKNNYNICSAKLTKILLAIYFRTCTLQKYNTNEPFFTYSNSII